MFENSDVLSICNHLFHEAIKKYKFHKYKVVTIFSSKFTMRLNSTQVFRLK